MKKIFPVKGYEKTYMVSDDGIVFRKNKYGLCALNHSIDKDGYFKVTLCQNGTKKNVFVHRLVAEAFIKKRNALCVVVNHIDENKQNNNVSNLEWCTVQQNTTHNNAHIRRATKHRKPIIAYCSDGVVKFDSITEASKALGVSHGNISSCLKGTRKTAGGMSFKYDTERMKALCQKD